MIPFVTILIRFFRAVRRSWKDPEFRGLVGLVVVTLLAGTLSLQADGGMEPPRLSVFQRRNAHDHRLR
jgi:hypothetical protein